MSAYGIFMGPIAGIIFCDYWLVKHRKYDVPALYDPRGIYRYKWGINWRAFISTIVVIAPLLPGLAYSVTPQSVFIDIGSQHLYSINWLFGFLTSSILYYVLNLLFPDRTTLIERVVYGTQAPVETVDGDLEGQARSEKTVGSAEEKRDPSEITVT